MKKLVLLLTAILIFSSIVTVGSEENFSFNDLDQNNKNIWPADSNEEDFLSHNLSGNVSPMALCWDCTEGYYESGDRSSYCECDEWEKCYDWNSKSKIIKGSTVYATDKCIDTTTLWEYYINCYWADEVKYTDYSCGDNNQGYFCCDGGVFMLLGGIN